MFRARWAIFWERLWPALIAPATVLGLFLAVSWFGLWLMLPALGRAIGLVLFALLGLASLYPLTRLRWPAEAEALRRLDRNSGILHRPATTVSDEMATAASDPVSAALWRAHVERSLAAAKRLRAGVPRPLLALRDPMALRALVGLLAVATFFAAGEDRFRRVAAAFDWQGVVPVANFRVDAWVSPPTYTGRPPVILQGLRPGEIVQKTATTTVPAGSTLVVRATGDVHPEVTVTGGLAESKDDNPTPAMGTQERRFLINGAGNATLRGLSIGDVTWAFAATPDRAPTIELAKEPEPQLRGTLKLTYKMEDDYGVSEARATFALKDKPVNQPRPLYQAPDFALTLPQARTRQGTGEMTKDLVEHPWAGTDVVMTLTAKDEAGNEGHSTPLEFRLPERPFYKPMARALIEQRRVLAQDAESRDHVLMSLDALALAPERFDMESSVYLGLRSIFWNLSRAKSDDDLREVVDRLWAMAVTIEDGNISDAEQALRAAQDALRQALERGASDEEIKRLMDQLRAAMDKFLQALAEQQQRNPQQQMARPLDPNARVLRPQDLKNMLDRLEQMARSGAKDAARQMLSQLQQMLDNLQMAQPGQQQQGGESDDMMQALDQLGDMIRRQQQLRDRTYQQGQDQRRDRQRGQRGDQNNMNELRQNQQALRDQLNKLLEQLRQRGMAQQGQDGQQGQQGQQGQGQQGQQGDMGQQLGRAGDAMGDAEGSLGDGNADGAVDAQGRALDALRRGAQSLAQQMQQQMGQGEGPGQPGRFGQPRADRDTDPLGRPLRGRDYGDDSTVKVPGEIDVQRARRILEELRRRFGEGYRPQLELDYIERLLKDF